MIQITRKGSIHIVIFALHSEEESVITLFKIFKQCNYFVTLILSKRLWGLVQETIAIQKDDGLLVFDNNTPFRQVFNECNDFLEKNVADLIIFSEFASCGIRETILYLKLIKKHSVCVGIFDYDSWFARLPPIRFNGWKIIKRSSIVTWLSCRITFKHFSAYFVSEIHRNSQNPFKELIRRRTNKKVFDFPFKLMEDSYRPNLDYEFPRFVIPGKIEKERRDYFSILNFFSNPSRRNYQWKLILCGRPIGSYGEKVLKESDRINDLMGEKRIEYFKEYVSKCDFDAAMTTATHILAPVKKGGYKFGKDSGALYDVFKYNKIGIFDDSYFYDNSLIEKNVLITFKNRQELHSIFDSIIGGSFSYEKIQNEFESVSSYFNKNKFTAYLKNEIDTYVHMRV